MKKTLLFLLISLLVAVVAACGAEEQEAQEETNTTQVASEVETNVEEDKTITFGLTTWTSTEAPTEIAKIILEEAGYEVDFVTVDQPVIFTGIVEQEIDFFMDAWLPHTEANLWAKYEDDLQKVATSYEEVPLGWVVPSYVEEDYIEDLIGQADKFDNRVVTIAPGAGIVALSQEVMEDYKLNEEYQLLTSSEVAMIAELENKISSEEPVIITGWRPHSMFAQYDLKFLEDTRGHFELDNVYVISYQGLEDIKPAAYNIMSNWSIEVSDLEEMMLAYEQDGTSFEVLAEQWVEENRDKVDAMLENK
ncbi:glycine/betaine ABC transporter substrate-binding protein [Anaerobacillus arseniciselenatis]|uniref:Glycine/betaine ABC transporter substrate-binding protein n=1 Tax=Anaerobacillus arseniciselenatis TaxID=85682 RepID=A0A1S2LRQ5_9BACI|nr:glycine betaine ABC transporter substrate-binding protein [Anaerobacillus arseniciselenatis]OIJ14065.1 glycine/betaine ABC transporter substrate-binding protein [Anaerobacillus arseniciselenatis]